MSCPMRRFQIVVLAVAAASCTQKDVVADVGGRPITITDVRESMKLERAKTPADAVEVLVAREQLAAAAVRKGLQRDAAVMARLKAAEREILAQAYLDGEVPIPDEKALRAIYESDAGVGQVREVELAHIFIVAPADGEAEKVRSAQNKATTAWARLLGGDAFDAVALDLSEDPSTSTKGGRIGVVREGAIAQDLFATAAQLEAGGVSKPVQTPYGFHVLKALSAVTTVKRPFDEVRGALAVQLRDEARAALTKRLSSEVAVRRFEQAMKSLSEGAAR
jgi:peptidyl-prolyl cis-trans isomerase C